MIKLKYRNIDFSKSTLGIQLWKSYIKEQFGFSPNRINTSECYAVLVYDSYKGKKQIGIGVFGHPCMGNEARIHCLYVIPEYRSNRIASKILEKIIIQCQDKNVDLVYIPHIDLNCVRRDVTFYKIETMLSKYNFSFDPLYAQFNLYLKGKQNELF